MEGFTIKKDTPTGKINQYYMSNGDVFYSIKKGPLIYEKTISPIEYKSKYDEYCNEVRNKAIARAEKSRINEEKKQKIQGNNYNPEKMNKKLNAEIQEQFLQELQLKLQEKMKEIKKQNEYIEQLQKQNEEISRQLEKQEIENLLRDCIDVPIYRKPLGFIPC